MNEKHLIDKVKKYLKNSKIPFIEETIEYIGIKRNFLIKNEKKDMHFISFVSQISKESPAAARLYRVAFVTNFLRSFYLYKT